MEYKIKVVEYIAFEKTIYVEADNKKEARKKAEMLRVDEDFYLHCSKVARFNYKQFYSEEVFKQNFKL